MTQKNQPESNSVQEFNLKHRVTGAAVLLFLGALVIPWLLGPPSEASKQVDAIEGEVAVISSPAELEDQLLAELDSANSEPEETVYISKITPLDVAQDSQLNDSAQATAVEQVAATEKQAEKPKEEVVKPGAAKGPQMVDKDKEKRDEEAKLLALEKAKADKLAKEKQESEQREKELQAALEAESLAKAEQQATKSVDVGWVVQVGLYLEKSGAETKISELKSQGFSASSTVVDTNRGPKTGTRVWLGPFAKRAEAEQENAKLVQRTKKDGFIRVYP